MPPIKNQAHFRPEDFSGRMLAQAGERKLPSGVDAFFAEPKPKRPVPRPVEKTSPPAERSMPIPQAETHASRSSDLLYDEILTLGEGYGRIVQELRMERERRADLEGILAGHQEASEAVIERLRREAAERERRTQRTVWGVVGGAAAAVAAVVAGATLYCVRTLRTQTNQLHQESTRHAAVVAEAAKTGAQAAAREALADFVIMQSRAAEFVAAVRRAPVIVTPDRARDIFDRVVETVRTALPQARTAATGGVAAASGGVLTIGGLPLVTAIVGSVAAVGVGVGLYYYYRTSAYNRFADWLYFRKHPKQKVNR